MSHEIRLACIHCDTDQYDGVTELPTDWTNIQEAQSYAASREEVPLRDSNRSPLDWYTHLGVCPECQKTEG